MKKIKVVLSLITSDNDFQREQARAAKATAAQLGVEVQILYAENDAVTQSQQLLKIIQAAPKPDVDAILVEPAGGTPMAQVARAAAMAKVGWVLLNRDADYLESLRGAYKVPVFSVSADHEEVGKIQAKQFGALLPRSGTVLYVQGPSMSSVAKFRTLGVQSALNGKIHLKVLRSANWTEASGYNAIASWLRLSTSLQEQIEVVGCQNDYIAMGARKAFQELSSDAGQERFSKLFFTGVDGMLNTGRAWVSKGLLTATVIVPAIASPALEMLVKAIETGNQPPAVTFVQPASFPELGKLTPSA